MLLIGLARVGGYLAGWDGGPDQLLFREDLEREALRLGQPNRMSPNTAAAFVLVGLALALLDVRDPRRGIRPAQLLALAAGLIALLALIGYAYSATSLIGVKRFIPMALNTAIAFAILSVGILCARPDRGADGRRQQHRRRRRHGAAAAARGDPHPRGRGLGELARPSSGGCSDQVMGMSLFVLANIVIFTALIWWNAASLDRMDRERRRAERRLGVQYTASRVLAESPRLDDAVPAILRGDLREPGLVGGGPVAGRPAGRRAPLRRPVALPVVRGRRNSWP